MISIVCMWIRGRMSGISHLQRGICSDGGKAYWSIAHVKWLKSLKLEGVFQETLGEYLIT